MADQDLVSDEIAKARSLDDYSFSHGSLGMHNPAYVRDVQIEADVLITSSPGAP